MPREPDYTVPFGEPWEVIASVADAAWLEPEDAAEAMRRLAQSGYRVVPVEDA